MNFAPLRSSSETPLMTRVCLPCVTAVNHGSPMTKQPVNRYRGDLSAVLTCRERRQKSSDASGSTSGAGASTGGLAAAPRESVLPAHKSGRACDCVRDVVTRTRPRTSVCSVADGDKCEDMIASDEREREPPNHGEPGLSHRHAPTSSPSTFNCNHRQRGDTQGNLY